MNSSLLYRVRKIVVTIITCVVILGLLSILYNYLATPRLAIIGPIGATVTISNIQTNATINQQQLTAKVMTVTLPAGEYTVSVRKDQSQQIFYTTTSQFQTQNINATLVAPLSSSVVSRQSAFYPINANGQLVYYNPLNESVETTNSQDTPSALYPVSLNSALAQSPCGDCIFVPQAFGVTKGNKAIIVFNNVPYILDGSVYTQLSTRGMPDSSTWGPVTVATNPAQNSFAIAIGQTIYLYTTPNANPQKIATLNKTFDQMSIGGGHIIVYSTRMPPAKENIRSYYTKFAIDPIIIDTSNRTQRTPMAGPLVDASISPDGKYAIIQNHGSHLDTVYNFATSSNVYTVPSLGVSGATWISSEQYTYANGASIWNMDLSGRIATLIGAIDSGTPTSITYNPDVRAYYVSFYVNSGNAGIVQLKNE